MAIDDYLESQVGVAVAATAAVLSPRARAVLRRGAVYGLAGALKAGDVVAATARGTARGVRDRGAPDEPVSPPKESVTEVADDVASSPSRKEASVRSGQRRSTGAASKRGASA